MLKRIFVFCLMLATLTVQVSASTQNGLKQAFDELNYSLTTEWDQKDQNFLNAQSEKFAQELRRLKDQGMSNQEMMDFTISQIKDKALVRDIQTTFSMVSINAMSAEEAHNHIKTAIEKSYARGASWNGSSFTGALVILFVVAGVLLLIGHAKVEDGCYQTYQCETKCHLGICQEECGYECI